VTLVSGESAERGRAARHLAPRSAHGDWEPAPGRPDPVEVLQAQAASRVQELVPIRYGCMLVSPFTFYRGAAAVMAADLASTPDTGIVVQAYLGASEFAHHGERVVRGQRISHAALDVFLGWQRNVDLDGAEHDFYLRQLWDWKASIDLSTITYWGLHAYTRACGWSLARAHARSGDRLAIAAYLGRAANFDRAIARFSEAYAEQNERDHRRLGEAVAAGEVPAEFGV
jgi:uncharacterized protein (DUF2252 family)